jgi:8-amino-7-oxononanoate synthase
MRLSRAGRKIAFAHNSADALMSVIEQLIDSDEAIVTGHRNVFIAVEAVYSMDGDVAPLKDIVHVIQKLLPLGNGHLIVDEAHSNGVLGPQGRGLVCELGLEDQTSVRLHTFGKALACNGGTPMHCIEIEIDPY